MVDDFDIATSAPTEVTLDLFPTAIPIGLRHGTVMVPSAAGPIDVTHFRGDGSLEDDLAHRDFTLNAIAWDPAQAKLIDPHGGVDDLRKGVLRAVGNAEARFEEDPLRALRAARFGASLQLEAAPGLLDAMGWAAPLLPTLAVERVRHEIEGILLTPRARRGMAWLRESGLEAQLAPAIRADAGPLLERLPPNLVLRLAAWLRGTDPQAVLGPLRFSERVIAQVARRVARHPIDGEPPRGEAGARRLVSRAGEETVRDLIRLREAELAVAHEAGEDVTAAHARLATIQALVERVTRRPHVALRRRDLALDGNEVMELMGIASGRAVGAALEHLLDSVLDDPSRNTKEALRQELRAWQSALEGVHSGGRPS